MTEELFRNDSYLTVCKARVARIADNGVVLDQTVFYPMGGGQPGDIGHLQLADGSTVTVTDTRKDPESGGIVHLCDPGRLQVGDEVEAHIDWDRRYRHMRVHTCLHLLCALIPFPVTGGSIGDGRGRLDFDMAETVDKEDLESRLNALIAADHPVSYRWITDEEMAQNMELVRTMSVKPPMGAGRVRLVEIAGVDLQPCGGTHLARTGEIGPVAIGKVEKKGRQNRRINLILQSP